MIKKMLTIADRYLSEIKFLINKQGCSLSLISGRVYWIDSKDNESTDSVPYSIYMELISSGILCKTQSEGMKVATPVYMLAIEIDPRRYLNNLDVPTENNINRLNFDALLCDARECNLGEWNGYTQVWCCDS